MSTPGSLSIEKEAVRWNRDVVERYASVAAVGVLAGIVATFARTPIHLPGHKAVLWMAPVLAARIVTRTGVGASIGALATIVTALTLGGRIAGGVTWMPLVVLAGVVLDVAVHLCQQHRLPRWQQLLFIALTGVIANWVCLINRLVEPTGALFSTGNLNDLGFAASTHALFGFVAAIVGAAAGDALVRRGSSSMGA